MAKYDIATGDNEAKQVWDEDLFRDIKKDSYWFPRFAGNSASNAIHTKRQLSAGKGETINFALRMRLGEDFIVDGQAEGNEYSMTTHNHSITTHKYRMPIRDNGELTRMRPPWDVTDEQRSAVKEAGAEGIDKLCFTALTTSPTRIFYSTDGSTPATTGTAATAKSALTTSSIIFPKLISYARTWCSTGGNRSQPPLRPIRVDGRNWLVLVIHEDCMYDLENDSTFAKARREAEVRGPTNPLFTNSHSVWGNVVVHSHESVPIATDAGSGSDVPWAKCVMFGAQALLWAWGRTPTLETELFDYGDEIGMDWSFIGAVNKPVFNSLDFGSVAVYLARTQISDA